MNDEGKIQLEESLNESVNVTTIISSDGIASDDRSAIDETATDAVCGPTAEVLSIDEHDTNTNYQNHLITNQINNNINTKSNDSDGAIVDEIPMDITEATDSADQITSNSTATVVAENGVSSDVLNEKPIGVLNSTDNDAANAVGFCYTHRHIIHTKTLHHIMKQTLSHLSPIFYSNHVQFLPAAHCCVYFYFDVLFSVPGCFKNS